MTKILTGLAIIAALAMSCPAAAAAPSVVTAVSLEFLPGSPDSPVPLAMSRGSSLEFVNLDPLGWHQISSTIYNANGEPIFGTRSIIGMGMMTSVDGVAALGPGRYDFVCPVHTGMVGVLTVTS